MRSKQIRNHLRAAWTHKLALWWTHYNGLYVNDAMRQPVIRLGQSSQALGHWRRDRRELTISESHIAGDPWLAVMDTLRHEMAHQYVDEVLQVKDESAHGAAFREACEKLRCSPKARAARGDLNVETTEDDRILRVLQKVLSLTDSPNEHEARAAMQKAHQLLMTYNVDLVALDRERQFDVRCLGPVKGRHTSAELWLASLLNRFFFVETLWTQTYDAGRDRLGTVLQIYGTSGNLDLAEYVYGYLQHVLDDLWRRYKAEKGLRKNRERQRYYAGVLAGFFQKLEQQEQTLVQTQALIWQGDTQLKCYYRYINPHVQTRRGGGVQATEAYHDGVKDGQSVTIHRPVETSGSGVKGFLE